MSHSFQIPSDIKPGTYVVRTELLALHTNTANFKMTPLAGPEFYIGCINIEVTGDGTITPEGETFPGWYNPTDPGLNFVPYYGDGSGVEHNSKYVSTLPSYNPNLSDTFGYRFPQEQSFIRVSMTLLLPRLLQ
jgi:hypothetical protein